jgi:hypothetical protein
MKIVRSQKSGVRSQESEIRSQKPVTRSQNEIIVFSIVLVVLLAVNLAPAQEACITVKVTDEIGQAVPGARVDIGFGTWIEPGFGWGGGEPNIVTGTTDKNGLCTLKGKGSGGDAGISVKKDGYYGSSGYSVDFTNVTGKVMQKWQPWNPTIPVVLKRKGKTIAMYARKVTGLPIPAQGVQIGFDLINADWVEPYGDGETTDFIFRLDRKPEIVVKDEYGPLTLYDVTLTVSFTNSTDGIQSFPIPVRGRSALRLPAMAPENGYITNIVKRMYQDETNAPYCDVREDENYFFRVRTQINPAGLITNALYGKIHGDFDRAFQAGILRFTYYLNPTPNDRNIEFDPSKNLFPGLSSLEEVRDP